MVNFTVLRRSLYSPEELHWHKVNHFQTHLLNEDLSSEILARVTQHLLRLRKTFPKKSGISNSETQIHRIHATVCILHFHSQAESDSPTCIFPMWNVPGCCVSPQPESRQLLDELGQTGKGRITFIEQLLSDVSYTCWSSLFQLFGCLLHEY